MQQKINFGYDYLLIYSSEDESLQSNVNKAIDKGYEPIGGVSFKGGCKGGLGIQAVYRNSFNNNIVMKELRRAYLDTLTHRVIGIVLSIALAVLVWFSSAALDTRVIVLCLVGVADCLALARMCGSYLDYLDAKLKRRRFTNGG